MMEQTRDSAANITTMVATSAVMIDWQNILTLLLVITGIVFNIVRIYEIKKKLRKEE
tara:strand:- start:421 stop:591 length:171 start_codon:yes stop_codon:yes gene_type:complete